MRSRMNTTTALVASLSLMAPSPLWAQETTPETDPEVALICPDGTELPCPEGVEPVPATLDEAMKEAMEAEAAEETAEEAPVEGGAPVSTTWNEIELLYPHIVVWVSIDEGPWAGFEGKLVLSDWDRVEDSQGRIVEIVFRPTEVVFSPV